uniref:Ribosomal protein S5 n=1 Tax=Lotharella vacuolata TaxID=74820 RepID=A0A0H5BK40_9EUKA|nr:ribosomal protein S5 [Lotharella vacuolata]
MRFYKNDMSFYKNCYKEMKLFNKWTYKKIKIKDFSLSQYIFMNYEFGDFIPHSKGKFGNAAFAKSKCSIIERFINSLMQQGRNSGKKIKAINIVKKAFSLINQKTNINPIQVLVTAIENCSPIEDSLSLGQKISNKRVSVDVSPYRRISQAIYMIAVGIKKASFKSEKSISDCICEEILNAYKKSSSRYLIIIISYGIRKKEEIERVAELSR